MLSWNRYIRDMTFLCVFICLYFFVWVHVGIQTHALHEICVKDKQMIFCCARFLRMCCRRNVFLGRNMYVGLRDGHMRMHVCNYYNYAPSPRFCSVHECKLSSTWASLLPPQMYAQWHTHLHQMYAQWQIHSHGKNVGSWFLAYISFCIFTVNKKSSHHLTLAHAPLFVLSTPEQFTTYVMHTWNSCADEEAEQRGQAVAQCVR